MDLIFRAIFALALQILCIGDKVTDAKKYQTTSNT